MDVHQARAPARGGFRIVSLDAEPDDRARPADEACREFAVADGPWSPAEEACFKVDFEDWLGGLTAR
jgi:hypothetical protein